MWNTSTTTLSVTQLSDTVRVQQLPTVTTRLSLSETPLQNLLTARAKSLLHPSKHYYKVEVPWCYCNSNMKTVQKIQKDKLFNENLVSQWQTEKIAKFYTMAKCVSSWPAHFKNGQIFRNWPWNGQLGNPGTGGWVQLIAEREILIVVASIVVQLRRTLLLRHSYTILQMNSSQ